MSASVRAAEERERLILFGTWLVGLGAVFLAREATGWPWVKAWPLFVILLGAGGAVTALVQRGRTRLGLWGIWWPLGVLVVGIILLSATTGMLGVSLAQVAAWWPLLVIALGMWFLLGAVFARDGSRASESLSVPLGGLSQAEVRVSFGGGELRVGAAEPGMLVSGTFEGGVIKRDLGPGVLELRPYDPPVAFWSGHGLRWDLALSAEIPVDLRLESGANRSSMDLSALRLRRLGIHTGASETRVRLPAQGATSVRVEAGLASVVLEVPPGVAVRVRGEMGLGSLSVDETRFPRSPEGWASPDYESAANRVEIEVSGGLGQVRIA